MTGSAAPDLSEPQRQSLWAVLFLAVRTLRQIGGIQIVIAVGFLLARLPSVLVFMALIAVVGFLLFVIAALQWWRYTFVVTDGELVVQRGVLQQQTLSIPLGRVQSASLEQKLLHRIVSLVQVTLDTAGTQTAEFVIDAVDAPVAEALQRAVANHRANASIDLAPDMPPPPEPVILRHEPRRIVKIALTQTPFAGLVLVAPLFAVADDLGRLLPFDPPEISGPDAPGWWLLWAVPLLLVVGLLISVVLNLVRVLLSDWNLTLRSTAAGLRRDAGLLSTTSVAATVPRVQLFGSTQTLLQRSASIRTVTLGTIGSTNLSLPGCDLEQAEAVRRLVLAPSRSDVRLKNSVSAQNVFLATRNTAVVTVLLAAGMWFVVGYWSLIVLVMIPYVWASVTRRVRLRRWGYTSDALADHREFIGWGYQELLLRKVNGVTLRQSLFERKRDLATVTLTTAAGAISIGMITLPEAAALRDHVLYHVETDHRAWM